MSDGAPPAPAERLPEGVEAYRRTDLFDEATVPKGLLHAHSTKTGTWGLIHVVEGKLLYRVVDERRSGAERLLTPEDPPGVVEPEILHEVKPKGRVRFCVEFFR